MPNSHANFFIPHATTQTAPYANLYAFFSPQPQRLRKICVGVTLLGRKTQPVPESARTLEGFASATVEREGRVVQGGIIRRSCWHGCCRCCRRVRRVLEQPVVCFLARCSFWRGPPATELRAAAAARFSPHRSLFVVNLVGCRIAADLSGEEQTVERRLLCDRCVASVPARGIRRHSSASVLVGACPSPLQKVEQFLCGPQVR